MYKQFSSRRWFYRWVAMAELLLLVACTVPSITPISTTPPTEINTDEMTVAPNTPILTLAVTARLSAIAPTTTEKIDLSIPAITTTPTFPLNPSEEITPYPTDIGLLEPVSTSDPTWAAIIQRVDELNGLYTLALSPDGELLAAVDSYDGFSRVYLWRIETGDANWVLELPQPLATSELVFSPDGTKLAVGASDVVQDIFVWDTEDGSQLHHFAYQASTLDMKFSPDNKWLAVSGIMPEQVTAWNLENEHVIELGRGVAIEFVPDSSTTLLAIARGQKSPNQASPIYFVDLQTSQIENLFFGEYFAGNIALSPDGEFLATFIANEEGLGTIRVLNLNTNEELNLEKNELGNISGTRQIGFSADGHLAVLHNNLTVWNIAGAIVGVLPGQNIKGFILTPAGSFLLTFGVFNSPLEVWRLPTS